MPTRAKKKSRLKHTELHSHKQTGCLQLFVRGFSDASDLIAALTLKGSEAEDEYPINFIEEFQKLCILDVLIRNTDRHFDNWLLKTTSACGSCQLSLSPKRYIKIAAIDSGLSFPHRIVEPRMFTYNWAMLPASYIPFKETIIAKYTPILQDRNREHELGIELRSVFKHHKDFEEQIFQDANCIDSRPKALDTRGFSPRRISK